MSEDTIELLKVWAAIAVLSVLFALFISAGIPYDFLGKLNGFWAWVGTFFK